ncbi:MAG: transglutaminase-like domain-containing protein [Steroidobacteraceae bacterium]
MIHTPSGSDLEPGPEYLRATRFFDCDHPGLRAAAQAACAGAGDDVGRAVRLFYWIRDGWRYDPFSITLDPGDYVASRVLARDRGYCITKAVLLCAAARAVGIPSAIGLSNVANHLTSEKLRRWMGGNEVFVDHGYSLLYVDGRWVKAATAFNLDLCERFDVTPTEFDGRHDAILQEFDRRQRRHMEYLVDHGCWSDLPFDRIDRDMRSAYPVGVWQGSGGSPPFEPDRRPG